MILVCNSMTTTYSQEQEAWITTQLWKLRALKQSSSPIIACTILKLVVRIARSVSPHLEHQSLLPKVATVNGGTNARRTSNTELTASHCDVLWSNCVSCAPNDIYPTVYSLSQLSYCGPSAEEHCCVAQLRVMLTHEHVDFFLNDRQNNCQTNNPTYLLLLTKYVLYLLQTLSCWFQLVRCYTKDRTY